MKEFCVKFVTYQKLCQFCLITKLVFGHFANIMGVIEITVHETSHLQEYLSQILVIN